MRQCRKLRTARTMASWWREMKWGGTGTAPVVHERKPMSSYQIPFDLRSGAQQHYPEPRYTTDSLGKYIRIDPDFRDNFEFTDKLKYVSYQRGRSAAYFIFERESTKTQVTVFMRDFEKLIPKLSRGSVKGTFTFVKTGMNYG